MFLDIFVTMFLMFKILVVSFILRKVKTKQSYFNDIEIVISISRNGHLKSCARFIIERSEIRKKQHAFKSVHFECRMVLFYTIWEKSRLKLTSFP